MDGCFLGGKLRTRLSRNEGRSFSGSAGRVAFPVENSILSWAEPIEQIACLTEESRSAWQTRSLAVPVLRKKYGRGKAAFFGPLSPAYRLCPRLSNSAQRFQTDIQRIELFELAPTRR
jgi:hypothetical protein